MDFWRTASIFEKGAEEEGEGEGRGEVEGSGREVEDEDPGGVYGEEGDFGGFFSVGVFLGVCRWVFAGGSTSIFSEFFFSPSTVFSSFFVVGATSCTCLTGISVPANEKVGVFAAESVFTAEFTSVVLVCDLGENWKDFTGAIGSCSVVFNTSFSSFSSPS